MLHFNDLSPIDGKFYMNHLYLTEGNNYCPSKWLQSMVRENELDSLSEEEIRSRNLYCFKFGALQTLRKVMQNLY